MSRMYSTCVSSWRVPLMNVTPETSGQSPCLRTICSAPSPFCTVTTVAPGKRPASACGRIVEPRRLGRDDRDVELGQLRRIVGRVHLAGELGPSGHREPVRPRARSACSGRRVSTQTSATRPDERRRGCRSRLRRRRRPARSRCCAHRLTLRRLEVRHHRRGEELLRLDRLPVLGAAGVDGDRDLRQPGAELPDAPRSARSRRRACRPRRCRPRSSPRTASRRASRGSRPCRTRSRRR